LFIIVPVVRSVMRQLLSPLIHFQTTDTYRPFIFPAQLSQIGSLNSDCVLTPFRNHSLKLGPSTHFSLLRVPGALLRNIELMSASKYTFRSLYFDSVCTGGKTTATPSFLCSHRLRACI